MDREDRRARDLGIHQGQHGVPKLQEYIATLYTAVAEQMQTVQSLLIRFLIRSKRDSATK